MHSMQLGDKSQALRLLFSQLIALAAATVLVSPLGWIHAYSCLLGGLIALSASAFFAARVFTGYRAQEPARLVGRFYGAELQKLILTGLLFAFAILWVDPLSIVALLGAFLFVQTAPLLASHFLF